jgi:uncharacterized membrane protein YdjX (TVP38/TMEM64 family)
MRRLAAVTTALIGFVLVSFGLAAVAGWDEARVVAAVEALGGGPRVAVVLALVLMVDVVLPVPSSAIMTLDGALFGPWLGAAVSTVGCCGSAAIGYGLGRTLGSRATRWTGADDPVVRGWLTRWGAFVVAATRPVPVLAEVTAAVAGVHAVPAPRFALGVVVGVVPTAAGYAWAGAYGSSGVIVAAALGVPGALLLIARWLRGRS